MNQLEDILFKSIERSVINKIFDDLKTDEQKEADRLYKKRWGNFLDYVIDSGAAEDYVESLNLEEENYEKHN